jgi:hypothetical protein
MLNKVPALRAGFGLLICPAAGPQRGASRGRPGIAERFFPKIAPCLRPEPVVGDAAPADNACDPDPHDCQHRLSLCGDTEGIFLAGYGINLRPVRSPQDISIKGMIDRQRVRSTRSHAWSASAIAGHGGSFVRSIRSGVASVAHDDTAPHVRFDYRAVLRLANPLLIETTI